MLESIQKNMTWRVIPLAALVAGTGFLLVQLSLMERLMGVGAGLSLRYTASLVMGQTAVVEGGSGAVITGLILHYGLSLLFTTLIAVVIHRWGFAVGVIGGAVLGVSLYGINFYFMMRFFPWFIAMNTSFTLLAHLVFGAMAGGVYELFDHYDGEEAPQKGGA